MERNQLVLAPKASALPLAAVGMAGTALVVDFGVLEDEAIGSL